MNAFYNPYISDTSESDSDSDGYSTEESMMNLAPKHVIEKGGMSYLEDKDDKPKDSGTKFETSESKNTSLFMISSRDRDNAVYPQPTYFKIRLPHVYKNVATVNISQISLLNSFFNFSASNGNTNMFVREEGRDPVNIQIRQGTYGVNNLVTELGSALNSTPLFADIDFQSFYTSFHTTGDFTLLFNVPGPTVYNSLQQIYEYGLTIDNVVSRYFNTIQKTTSLNYTLTESYVAYYYPIIKEMTIQNISFSYANQTLPSTYTSWYDYIVFAFQGLTDPYITAFALDGGNQVLFDSFHYKNSFRASLINQYTCEYNTNQGRLTIRSPSLNQSIATDLSNQYNFLLTSVAYDYGFTSLDQFQSVYSNSLQGNAVVLSWYNYLQGQFATYFGINFGKYSIDYYLQPNNPIAIYNTKNKYGWITSLSPNITNNVQSNVPEPIQISTLWENILVSYENKSDIISYFSTGYLSFPNAGDTNFGFLDIPFPIQPTTYVQTKVESRIRQSLSFMTLPRYATNRSSNTNMVYNLSSASLLIYNPVDDNDPNKIAFLIDSKDTNFNLYTIYQSMFLTPQYMRSETSWTNYVFSQILSGYPQAPFTPLQTTPMYNNPPVNDIALKSYRPYLFLQLNNDQYSYTPNARFNVSLYVETQTNKAFDIPISVTWYKDRAGFMADVTSILGGGLENPRHYFLQKIVNTDVASVEFVVPVNNLQISYFLIRPLDATSVSNLPLRVFCCLTDKYGTYTEATHEDTYDMPYAIDSIYDQFSPVSQVFQYPLTSIYDSNIFKLGYDISGVSNNLLDYSIQGGGNMYYDPTNMRYSMHTTSASLAPNPSISSPTQWSLYFASNNTIIRDLSTNNVYASTNQNKPVVTQNEYSMVNWFAAGNKGSNIEPIERYYQASSISLSTIFMPCINNSPLNTDVSTVQFSTIFDTEGINGIGLYLPPNQYLSLQSLVIKFAYTQPNGVNYTRANQPLTTTNQLFQDSVAETNTVQSPYRNWDDWYETNRRNTKMGIFLASSIQGVSVSSLSMYSSIATLSLASVTQVNNYQNSVGTLKTREPDWGTFYTYTFQQSTISVWDLSTSWVSTILFPDFAPSTNIGFNSYPNTFLTKPLQNDQASARSFGIATSVANPTMDTAADFNNSYVAIPFYYDQINQIWTVGNFQGLCYTNVPCLPPLSLLGAAPYYGPTGGYGWFAQSTIMTSDSNMYYWNANLRFHNLDIVYNPATDLNAFGGPEGIKTEFQDTFLFVYDDPALANNDMMTSDQNNLQYSWGKESAGNYVAFDDQSGYNFLSYVHDFPANANTNYYVNVRAYDPIPSMYTGIRIIGKNVTDFGSPTFAQIISEIQSLSSLSYVCITDAMASTFVQSLYTNPPDNSIYLNTVSTNNVARASARLSREYADALQLFDTSFSVSKTFGRSPTSPGSNVTFQNFQDCYTQFSTVYTKFVSSFQTTATIFSTASAQLTAYANQKYSNILPPFALQRNNLSDPLPFQFLFSTYINPTYANRYDEWGLGYNLGFNKADVPSQPRTLVVSDTFIRIVHNYIYLKISPELNMNRLAVSNKENLAETHDPSAEDLKYFSKILLNDFASFCSAAVQMPIQFHPPLGKLDAISFQLLDKNGTPINNVDCEYDIVLEATEIQYTQKDNSAMLKPTIS